MPKDNEVDEKVVARYEFYARAEGMGEADLCIECSPDGGWVNYDDHAATVAELRAEVADLKVRLDREEQAHSRTISERDRAEEALGDMFTAATGRPAEWSSAWGYLDAIEEVEDHVAVTQRKADAAERRLIEVREIQRTHYGDGVGLHLAMIRWARDYDTLTGVRAK